MKMRNKRKTGEVMMIGPQLLLLFFIVNPAFFFTQLNCNKFFIFQMYRETHNSVMYFLIIIFFLFLTEKLLHFFTSSEDCLIRY